MAGKRIWWGLAALVVMAVAYAWIDGGEVPLRTLNERVPIPGGEG